jgi:hypothetical protein
MPWVRMFDAAAVVHQECPSYLQAMGRHMPGVIPTITLHDTATASHPTGVLSATAKVQVLRFAQDDNVEGLCLVEEVGSEVDHASSCNQFLSII